jgi:hypothetical protein
VALSHHIGDATELAYLRSDVLAKRARLMQAWGTFLSQPPARTSGKNVVALGGRHG